MRLGLVQTALGAIVVLTTSTTQPRDGGRARPARDATGHCSWPCTMPVQILRPRLGYGSDVGGRRTPWIIGGMAVLALGGVGAAVATAWMGTHPWLESHWP